MSDDRAGRTTQFLALDLVDAPELDARITRDDNEVEALGRDIVRRGQQDPIKVYIHGDRFVAIDGWTRCVAMRRQALTHIEAFVFPTYELAHEGKKYAANIFRLAMTPADEAKMFYELYTNECGQDIEQLAALVNQKVSYVDKRLQLILGDDLVFAAVRDKQIVLGVAEELNKISMDDYRRYYLEHAIKSGATRSVVAGWVQEWRSMYENRVVVAPPAEATQGPIAVNTYDPHRCYCCGKSDPRFIPESVSIHSHCKLAILDPLIAAYHGGASES